MSFVSTDPVSQKGKSTTWLTPLWLIKELGEFDLDPCAYPGHITASARWHGAVGDRGNCGLRDHWPDHARVWLNPPYGREQRAWMEKMQAHGNGIALLFARLETKWIQPFIADGFFLLEGRIKFLNDRFQEESNAGAPSMLIPFGRKNIGAILSSNLKGRWFQ
jgi:hypothetical protein